MGCCHTQSQSLQVTAITQPQVGYISIFASALTQPRVNFAKFQRASGSKGYRQLLLGHCVLWGTSL